MDPLWTLTHLWRGPRVGQLLFPPSTLLRSWGPTARLGPTYPAKGLPRPSRKHSEPSGSDGVCHGSPPLVQPSCPHSYPPLFPTLSYSCASRAVWSPGGPFLVKAPSFGGESSPHLTEDICSFVSLAKNRLSSGMCETGTGFPHPMLSRPPAQAVA